MGSPVKVAVSIFDEVTKGDNRTMGAAVFDVGELLAARGNTKAKKVKGSGMLYATVRKSEGSGVFRFRLKGIKLTNTEGFLRKSDPFYELNRRVDVAGANTWDAVFRSETIKNDLSPSWKEESIDMSVLCGGNANTPIRVDVYDYESSGKHVLMGQFETTVNALVDSSTGGSEDMSKAMTMKTKGKETGSIVVLKAEISGGGGSTVSSVTNDMAKASISSTPAPVAPAAAAKPFVPAANAPGRSSTFVDYISGGCELNVIVAIDFTGSNGDPRKPGTLHHLNPSGKNDYEKAISSIVGILSKYDTDKKFPVLGFGAKYGGVIRHAFQCGPTEEVYGVQGVLDAYHGVFKSGLVMSGPTVFDEIIRTAAARAESSFEKARQQGKQVYTILLIISDGAVSDPETTAESLRQVCNAPLSAVIVGVGNADFSPMEFLDECFGPGERDIAQFVEFNKHSRSPADLSSATLQEIPQQLTEFFQSRGIQANSALRASESQIIVEEEEEIDLSLDIGEEEIVVTGCTRSVTSW